VPPPPLGDTVYKPDLRLGLLIVKLTVLIIEGDGAGGASTRLGQSISITLPRRRKNNVESVGNVAQSENSPEKFQ
jgi:hypothetical protein